jgi:hypothetical protein
MPYRPRELVIRAREAAILLLRTIDRNETVQRFLDLYAAEYRRPGRADHPALYREKLETIRREAILAIVLRIEAALPRRLNVSVKVRDNKKRGKAGKGKKKGAPKTPRHRPAGIDLAIPLLDLFREEFFVALGQTLEWDNDDAQEFWHDLELYEKLTAAASQRAAKMRGPGRGSSRTATRGVARARAETGSGPFVDRVGFLLDPSLMDQARREAGKFQTELHVIADRILARTFMRRAL